VGRGDLAEAIWGDDVPDAWETTLNALASRLRRALAPLAEITAPLIIRGEPGRCALTLPGDVFVDWERARDAIHEADRLVFAGVAGAALAEARVAMEIAARGVLPGEGAPWIEGQRQTLREIRLRACERTVEAELARGQPDIAETEARLLLALDPLREASYRWLMRALAAGGNPAQAAPGLRGLPARAPGARWHGAVRRDGAGLSGDRWAGACGEAGCAMTKGVSILPGDAAYGQPGVNRGTNGGSSTRSSRTRRGFPRRVAIEAASAAGDGFRFSDPRRS
jgi:hypothetical protein